MRGGGGARRVFGRRCRRGVLGAGCGLLVVVVIPIVRRRGGGAGARVRPRAGEFAYVCAAGEEGEEARCEVEAAVGGAGTAGALIHTSDSRRLAIIAQIELFAAAAGTAGELGWVHGDEPIAILVVFSSAGVWARICLVPRSRATERAPLFQLERRSTVKVGVPHTTCKEGMTRPRLVGFSHGRADREEKSGGNAE